MKQIALVIEGASDGEVWGRVHFEDNLIVESAPTIDSLQKRMKKLLKEFHELETKELEFDLQYDVAGLFDEQKVLNASALAKEAGINASLMRQYASGVKNPSIEQAKKIEKAIHQIGKALVAVKLAGQIAKTTSVASKTYSASKVASRLNK